MAEKLVGCFVHKESENMEEYLEALEIPESMRKMMLEMNPTVHRRTPRNKIKMIWSAVIRSSSPMMATPGPSPTRWPPRLWSCPWRSARRPMTSCSGRWARWEFWILGSIIGRALKMISESGNNNWGGQSSPSERWERERGSCQYILPYGLWRLKNCKTNIN